MNMIEKPTKKLIQRYIDEFNEKYTIDEKVVEKIFRTFPQNSSYEEVLAKVIILNNRYSAGLTNYKSDGKKVDVLSMSNHVVELSAEIENCIDIDKARELVIDISKIGDEKEQVISFASKYLAWTFRNKTHINVPIYDGYVKGILYVLNKNLHFYDNDNKNGGTKFTQKEIQDYCFFSKVFDAFYDYISNSIEKFGYRDLDKYLWKYAKDKGVRRI